MGSFAHENRCDCSKIKYHFEKLSAIFVLMLFMENISSTNSVCSPHGTLLLAKPSITNELTTPGYPASYPLDSTCVWNISAPLGHIIKLTFSDFVFRLTSDKSCLRGDHVELWDGSFSSDELIKRYCFTVGKSDPGPEPHFSSGHRMSIKFKSDGIQAKPRGFKALYTAVKLVTSCSSSNTAEQNNNIVLTNASGTFASPNFPSSYPSSINCTWIIKLPSIDSVVSLVFHSFELDNSRNPFCRDYMDSVEVFNGIARKDDLLGRYCSKTPPPAKIFSTGRKLTIVFQSKKSYMSKKGFSSSFASLNKTNSLGACLKANTKNNIQILNREGGVITSPYYPQYYPNNMECIWTFIAPAGKRIKFVFMGVFEMEQDKDYIEIRDGSTNTSFSLGRFDRTKPTKPVYTSGPQALVRFKTDDYLRYKGFYLIYEAVKQACFPSLASLTASPSIEKEFTSPCFPSPYPEGFLCEWKIMAPKGYSVKLHFVKLSLQYIGGFQESCTSGDYVELRDGSSSSEIIKHYCSSGKSSDQPKSRSIFSTGNSIYVKFKSDVKGPNKNGFRITYTAIKQVTSCSSRNSEDQNRNIVFKSPSGNIKSSNFPRKSVCTWNIEIPGVNSVVKVTFPAFEVGRANGHVCSLDGFVEIFDGLEAQGVSLGYFCSVERPPTIYTTGRRLTIDLYTGTKPIGSEGFLASYSSISQTGISGKCDEPYSSHKIQVTNLGGAIVSPRFPQNYPNNMKCTWSITVPSDKRIKLQFLGYFGVVEHGCTGFGINDDYVSIKDGSSDKSKLLGKFCHGKPDAPILTSSRHALVEFRSDGSGAYKGFYLIYEAVPKGSTIKGYCSPHETSKQTFKLSKSSGSISSPDYPNDYPKNINCIWIITVPHGKRVKLTLEDLDITYYYTSCNSGHLEVRDGQYDWSRSIGKYCGTTLPGALHSSERYMFVQFTSYGALTTRGKGFIASFTAVDAKSSAESQEAGSGSGTVVGIIIAILVAVVFIALLFCCYRKHQRAASYRSVPNPGARQMTTLHSGPHPPDPNRREDASASPSCPQPSAPPPPDTARTQEHQGDEAPPKYEDLPPPYPGLAADSSQPQYPTPGEQYPWQPGDQRSNLSAPQC